MEKKLNLELSGPKFFVRDENPMMNPLVLDMIFDMLDVNLLKNCRLVCHRWKYPASFRMFKKCTISIDAENQTRLDEQKAAMLTYGSRYHFQNFTCDKITHSSYPNIWKILGNHVKSFTVSHWWGDSKDLTLRDYEDLLLRRCPCLEEIVLPSTRNFRKAQNFLLCSTTAEPGENLPRNRRREIYLNLKHIKVTGNYRPEVRFWRIVSCSPQLKRLQLECHLVPEFWDPNLYGRTQWVERMSNLSELEVRSYANEGATTKAVQHFMDTPWKLKTCSYECYDLSESLLKAASEHMRHTLEKLEATLFNKKYEPWPADLRGDWMTSSNMIHLKHYKFQIDEHCEGPIFCRTLVLSMFIPNLECLVLGMYEDGENRSEWEQGLFATIFHDCMTSDPPTDPEALTGVQEEDDDEGKGTFNLETFKRPKFRTLVLPPRMKDTSFIQPVLKIYPNLNDLTLDNPAPQVISQIFLHWRQLERLTLTLAIDNEEYFGTNWNFILTGTQLYQGVDNQQVLYFNGASIVNLTKLMALDIRMVSTESESYYDLDALLMNDGFIYNGLSHLSTAQSISITGHRFSEEAVTFLRGNLWPYCFLNFHCGSISSTPSLVSLHQNYLVQSQQFPYLL